LEYANTVWSPYKQYLIEEVQKVQKRATKLVHECVAESSICACKTDNETVEHVLFRCANHDHSKTQLMDVVDNIWISATAKNFVYSKAHMLIAPNSSGFVTKFENCTLKEALFQF